MIRVGVVGYGYWGPNVVRNFQSVEGTEISMICDRSEKSLQKARRQCPSAELCHDAKEVTSSPHIDAVAVITPVSTHFDIAKNALLNGKHIFVEKPFTTNSAQAQELIDLATKKNLITMVDHTFVFTEAVEKIKDIISADVLGKVHYYDSMRVNLGLFQHDVDVIWDLAPHDFAIMDYVINEKPVALAAHAKDHFRRGLANTAYVTVYFEEMIAHFNLNWLSPVKIRLTLIGGQNRMLMWDDLKSDEKIKVYDKGVTFNDEPENYQSRVGYRLGDIWMPQLDSKEALNKEVKYFVNCVSTGDNPINNGEAGLRIVRMLEAAELSSKNQGKIIEL